MVWILFFFLFFWLNCLLLLRNLSFIWRTNEPICKTFSINCAHLYRIALLSHIVFIWMILIHWCGVDFELESNQNFDCCKRKENCKRFKQPFILRLKLVSWSKQSHNCLADETVCCSNMLAPSSCRFIAHLRQKHTLNRHHISAGGWYI